MRQFNSSHFRIRNAASRSPDEIRERLISLADRAQGIVNAADGRDMTTDESRQVSDLHSQFQVLQGELDALEASQAMTTTLSAAGRISLPDDVVQARNRDHAAGRTPGPPSARSGVLLPPNCSRPSQLLFPASADPWAKDVETFFSQVANRVYSPRLLNATGVSTDGESGGFSVPGQWFGDIVDQGLQAAEYWPRCRLFVANGNTLTVPMPDMNDRESSIAGFVGNWAAEASAQSAQKLKWRQVNVPLNKVFLLAESSSELIEDGINYSAQLTNALTAAAAYSIDNAVLSGNGVGKPLGILNDGASIGIDPVSGQTAQTVIFENIVALYSRVSPQCQRRAVWFVSPSLIPCLLQMQFPGSNQPLLLGNGSNANAAAGEFAGTILGRPVIVSEIAKAVGEPGDIVFADLSQFAIVVRNGARIEMSNAPGFASDILSWRLIMRIGGQSMWNAPVTPFSGGPTLSYATWLKER